MLRKVTFFETRRHQRQAGRSTPSTACFRTPATDGKLVYVTFFEAGDQEIIAPNVAQSVNFPWKMVVAAY